MQTTGYRVGLATELGPGVQHGHHRFQGGNLGGRMNVHGNTTSVVIDSYGLVRLNRHDNMVTAAGHSLVDAVVSNLINQMMQATLIGTADIHTGSTAYRFPPAQNLYVLGGVFGAGVSFSIGYGAFLH